MEYLMITNFIKFTCRDIESYVFKIPAREILPLYYVAVRGRDSEEGAVQRVLSTKRISDISEYVLKGNAFVNTFILNWANPNASIDISDQEIKIPKISESMQIIDGQHRLEGIKRAVSIDSNCGNIDILVVLTNRLTTSEAAEIFLNINSEQKQVPKSLVYDLFGELKDPIFNINRARELTLRMNDDIDSPYYQCVKMPGTNRGRIDLSTMVSSIRDYLKVGGIFDQYKLSDLEVQYVILSNYQTILKNAYGSKWISTENPFMTSAGYFAEMKFFCEKLIPLCALQKSFEISTLQKILNFEGEDLLLRNELKNQQGKEQRVNIFSYLQRILTKDTPTSNGYKF